jgi:hypothetical protein
MGDKMSKLERPYIPLVPFSALKTKQIDGKLYIKVDVYWNIHKQCYSLRHRGKVVAHTKFTELRDVEFIVNQKGRERTIREGKKYVHAFVRGWVVVEPLDFSWWDDFPQGEVPQGEAWDIKFLGSTTEYTATYVVEYNPRLHKSFITQSLGGFDPIHQSEEAYLTTIGDSSDKRYPRLYASTNFPITEVDYEAEPV